jgi:hypothetical protein
MTTAAEVVRLQADLVDTFRIQDPRAKPVIVNVDLSDGVSLTLPISRMGGAVDGVMFGDSPEAMERATLFPVNYPGGQSHAPTCAPLVAAGLTLARAYRVQENMTGAIVERADSLAKGTVLSVPGFGICPPRPAGFALFEEPAPLYNADELRRAGLRRWFSPGIGLITWTMVADTKRRGRRQEFSWAVIIWDDMANSPPGLDKGEGYGDNEIIEHLDSRFIPITGFTVTPGDELSGTPLAPTKLGERPIRNPMHVTAALWQMLGETIEAPERDTTEQTTEGVDRRTQRRARASGVIGQPEVTTVVLRRRRAPVQHPGSGTPHTTRIWIPEDTALRWVGPRNSPDRKLVRRPVRAHWSCNRDLPERNTVRVSELRR